MIMITVRDCDSDWMSDSDCEDFSGMKRVYIVLRIDYSREPSFDLMRVQ